MGGAYANFVKQHVREFLINTFLNIIAEHHVFLN